MNDTATNTAYDTLHLDDVRPQGLRLRTDLRPLLLGLFRRSLLQPQEGRFLESQHDALLHGDGLRPLRRQGRHPTSRSSSRSFGRRHARRAAPASGSTAKRNSKAKSAVAAKASPPMTRPSPNYAASPQTSALAHHGRVSLAQTLPFPPGTGGHAQPFAKDAGEVDLRGESAFRRDLPQCHVRGREQFLHA